MVANGQKNFNSRPSARGDDSKLRNENVCRIFQFTPLREGRRGKQYKLAFTNEFQFTPLREGRREGSTSNYRLVLFQFTPLREGRLMAFSRFRNSCSFQFTPLREGRRVAHRCAEVPGDISIHAPPRGATRLAPAMVALGLLFQFTPLREGRPSILDVAGKRFNFNSRPSARGDSTVAPAHDFTEISIHAPPRGATYCVGWKNNRKSISIHAPPRGATRVDCHKNRFKRFQFTPLREGRRPLRCCACWACNFNSRPSARGDGDCFGCCPLLFISIHAPPRGATGCPIYLAASYAEFQFTPLREGRLSWM